MKMIFLGRSDNFVSHSFIDCFAKKGYEVTVLNTKRVPRPDYFIKSLNNVDLINIYSDHYVPYGTRNLWFPMLLKKYKVNLLSRYDEILFNRFNSVFSKDSYDFIFAWWGLDVIYEISILFEFKIDVPIILYIDAYPSFYNKSQQAIEDYLYKMYIKKLSGIIYYSSFMLDVITKKFNIEKNNKNMVLLEPLSQSFYFTRTMPKLSSYDNQPHLVFTGRTDFDGSWDRRRDDVRSILNSLEKNKIHIHVRKNDYIKETKFIHFYENFTNEEMSNGNFANFLTQFDGVICVYNEKQNYLPCWKTSLGIRFASAFTGGIPVIVHSSYLSSKKFIEDNHFGFSFTSMLDLKQQLLDTQKMKIFETNVKSKGKLFGIENQFARLDKFICNVLNK